MTQDTFLGVHRYLHQSSKEGTQWQHIFDPLKESGRMPHMHCSDAHALASPMGVFLLLGLWEQREGEGDYGAFHLAYMRALNGLREKTFTAQHAEEVKQDILSVLADMYLLFPMAAFDFVHHQVSLGNRAPVLFHMRVMGVTLLRPFGTMLILLTHNVLSCPAAGAHCRGAAGPRLRRLDVGAPQPLGPGAAEEPGSARGIHHAQLPEAGLRHLR